MKTSDIIKSGILSLAVIFATIAGVQAQKSANQSFERQLARVNASLPAFAELKPVAVVYNITHAASFDLAIEAPMELEEWMTNINSWANIETEKLPQGVNMEVLKEEDVSLEAWMFDFDIPNDEDITEPELQLEDWMLSADSWTY